MNDNQKPVLSISERFVLRRDEKAAFEQRRKEEEAAKLQKRLASLLTEYQENCPEVVAMCAASGVQISTAISKGGQTLIVFTHEGNDATYNYNGGKSVGLTQYWGEHDIDQYAEVLHAALFAKDVF